MISLQKPQQRADAFSYETNTRKRESSICIHLHLHKLQCIHVNPTPLRLFKVFVIQLHPFPSQHLK